MPIDFCLKEQWKQTINVARRNSSRPNSGDPAFDAEATRLVRWEPKADVVETSPGNFRQTTHWFVTDELIEMGDRVWGPGEVPATDSPRLPASVDDGVDEEGVTTFFEVRV